MSKLKLKYLCIIIKYKQTNVEYFIFYFIMKDLNECIFILKNKLLILQFC